MLSEVWGQSYWLFGSGIDLRVFVQSANLVHIILWAHRAPHVLVSEFQGSPRFVFFRKSEANYIGCSAQIGILPVSAQSPSLCAYYYMSAWSSTSVSPRVSSQLCRWQILSKVFWPRLSFQCVCSEHQPLCILWCEGLELHKFES